MLTLQAPAKLNLTLEVLGKRTDGYHEIRSVLQAVSLCDTLLFDDAENLSFHCGDSSWDAEKSLVVRAAEALKARLTASKGARINLGKRIPLSSGLGGDSSDAAAVIKGLNRLWNLRLTTAEIVDIAASFGSDVPFFLNGPTALALGRGEILTSLPSAPRSWVVLLFPAVEFKESKTGFLYSLLGSEHYTSGSATEALAERLARGEPINSAGFYNVFEKVAFEAFNGLNRYFHEFQQTAGVSVHLAGAGPTLFALFDHKTAAAQVKQELERRGFHACLVETFNSPAV